MSPRPSRRLPVLLLGTLALALWGAAAPVPAPVVVEPAVDAPAGSLSWQPAAVSVPPGGGTATATLRNGSDRALTLQLAIRPVAAGDRGEPVLLGETADHVTLPTDTVFLDPGEAAHIEVAVSDAAGGPLGLVATAPDADGVAVVAWLLHGPNDPDGVSVDAGLGRDGHDGVVNLTLRGASDAVVEGRLRVRSWTGQVLTDTSIPPTLVLAKAPRHRTLRFPLPLLAGPHHLEVVVGDGTTTHRADDRAWLWHPWAAWVLAGLFLTVTAAAVWRRWRSDARAPVTGG